MESFKSIAAIETALNNINSLLGEMGTNISSMESVSSEFEQAWKSTAAFAVRAKITELVGNLNSLKTSVNNIGIKVSNAKNLVVAANETNFKGSAVAPVVGNGTEPVNYVQ